MAEALLDAVVAIAAQAGALAMRRQREGYRRWEKPGGEPVCEVDLEVDALLRAELGALDSEIGWLSEESADDPARLACRRVWVVDPIDGTRDFLRGRDGWAVSIALVDRGQVVIGVLDAPARGLRYAAGAGQGATRNGAAIHCAMRTDLAGARVPADQLRRADRDLITVAKPNSIALRIAMVAEGAADLVATLRRGREWDIAAADLIAREAGAAVTDALGVPIAYNTAGGEAFGMLACAAGIHAAALERLRERAPQPD